MAKRGQTRPELRDYALFYGFIVWPRDQGFNFVYGQVFRTLGFLQDQGLVQQCKVKREGETVFRAIPRAIDALIRQIQADGEITSRDSGVLAGIEARMRQYHDRVSQAPDAREREKVVSLEVARVKRRM